MVLILSRMLFVSFSLNCLLLATASLAQEAAYNPTDARGEYEDHVLSDGQLTGEELAAVVKRAQEDLKSLLNTSISKVKQDLEADGVFSPQAWMLMKDGEIKKLRLGSEAQAAPSDIQVLMYRASLKSVARHGEIHSALIAYPGSIKKDGRKEKIAVIEHEHRLGVAGLKLIPVKMVNGIVQFGAAIPQEKKFAFFYDDGAVR